MIMLLIDIATKITKALHKTNRHVGWRVVVEKVAGGPGRVLSVNRMTIAKLMMSTDGAQFTATFIVLLNLRWTMH